MKKFLALPLVVLLTACVAENPEFEEDTEVKKDTEVGEVVEVNTPKEPFIFNMPNEEDLEEQEFNSEELLKKIDDCHDIMCTVLVNQKDSEYILGYGYDLVGQEVYGKTVDFSISPTEDINLDTTYKQYVGYSSTPDGGIEVVYVEEQ